MARAIDADELLAFPYSESAGTDEQIENWIEECGLSDEEVIDRAKKLCWTVIDGFINVVKTEPTLTPPNEALTLDQLREMDGEPVWIVDIGDRKWFGPGWAIVDRENNLVRTAKNWNPVFFEKYGESWLAYRRPKEEQ